MVSSVPVQVSMREEGAARCLQAAAWLRCSNGSGTRRARGVPSLPAGDTFSLQEKKKSLGEEEICHAYKQTGSKPSGRNRLCCLHGGVSREKSPLGILESGHGCS